MSSLQKFHRRTLVAAGGGWPPVSIGQGDATHGYWLGNTGAFKLIVAPKSTELVTQWGSYNTLRNIYNTTDGLSNTNTLYGFGSAAHPAAYYAKSLTTGGYNTWYLPAKLEALTMYTYNNSTPYATTDKIAVTVIWTSTEYNGKYAYLQYMNTGNNSTYTSKNYQGPSVRAIRRATV